VYQTLQARLAAAAAGVLLGVLAFVPAHATTFVPSQTFKAGTRIACVLDEHLDSSKLAYGDSFKLRVVDTTFPALHGAEIIGYITDVHKPSGAEQGRVGFFLTNIKLPNGEKKPITAYVVNRRVKQFNPAAQYAARNAPPPMPNGVVTPGPIAWQMRLGPGGPSTVSESKSPTLGGYVYASASQWPLVVEAGTPVTVELQENLTIP